MSFLSASIFLDVFGELCTSGDMQGRATLDLASEDYSLGVRDMSRTLYTLTVSSSDFGAAKEQTVFRFDGRNYKAVKPPIVKQDALVFVCVITQ